MTDVSFQLDKNLMRKKLIKGLCLNIFFILTGISFLFYEDIKVLGFIIIFWMTITLVIDLINLNRGKVFDNDYRITLSDQSIRIFSSDFDHVIPLKDLKFSGYVKDRRGNLKSITVSNSLNQKFKFECLENMSLLMELLSEKLDYKFTF